ncbi:MAG: hypothetical protein R2873_33265 [Caldilineaceae bacterium]
MLATLWSSAQDQADLDALAQLGIEIVARHLPSWRSLVNAAGDPHGATASGRLLPATIAACRHRGESGRR